MKSLFSFLVLTLASLTASATALDCNSKDLAIKAVYDNFPGAGYWMQAAGDCRITYTSIGGTETAMYNICRRERENISSRIDGFALPEGDIYTHPSGGSGLKFYEMAEGIEKGNQAQPFYTDANFLGNYQSIGILEGSTKERRLIRVAMGNQAGMVREYKVEKDANNKPVVTPINDRPTPICKNIDTGGLDTEIPMISRDGTMISGRNRFTQKTEIYKIDMKTTQCSLVMTVPTLTNKVSFDYENKNIYYVTHDPNTNKKRLTTMEVATGKVNFLSGPDEDVQYVTNRRDGTIFYSRRNGARSDLVELAPNSIASIDNRQKSFEALGLLWADACGNTEMDYDMALSVGRRLDKSVCESLLKPEAISRLEDEYSQIPMSDLQVICQGSKASGVKGTR